MKVSHLRSAGLVPTNVLGREGLSGSQFYLISLFEHLVGKRASTLVAALGDIDGP